MRTPYSHIIKSMHDQTGKSLNSLLYEWNKATREIEVAELRDPNAYSKLTDELLAKQSGDNSRRDLSPLIADKFRKNVLGDGDPVDDVDSTGMENDQMDQFEQSINQGIEGDAGPSDEEMSFDTMFGDDDDTFNAMFGGNASSIGSPEDNEGDDKTSDDEFSFDDIFDDEAADSPTDTDSDTSTDDFDLDSLFDD